MIVKSAWDKLMDHVDLLHIDIDVKEAKKLKEHAHSEVGFCLENDCAEKAWERLFFRIDELQKRYSQPIAL